MVHLDSTSFHVDGEYHSHIDAQGIRLVKSYSRDHRLELNQVILNLIIENQAKLAISFNNETHLSCHYWTTVTVLLGMTQRMVV